MRILLTGSSGFIGTYFKNNYCKHYVIRSLSLKKDKLTSLHVNDIDVVIHLSAIVHQPTATKELYDEINVHNAIKLALRAKESSVKQFIFMSTIAVYDTHLIHLNEASHLNPTTLYGQSKLEAEKQLLALEDEFFKISIIRPPMVYGENAPGNIHSLIKLIDKIPILPFGKIENNRSFVYVGNLCAMLDCIIQRQKSGIFLAADDEILSTTKLIELIAKAKNKKIYLFHVKLFERMLQWLKPSMYQRLFGNLVVDNTQTKAMLDFNNPYSVEEGISLMIRGEQE